MQLHLNYRQIYLVITVLSRLGLSTSLHIQRLRPWLFDSGRTIDNLSERGLRFKDSKMPHKSSVLSPVSTLEKRTCVLEVLVIPAFPIIGSWTLLEPLGCAVLWGISMLWDKVMYSREPGVYNLRGWGWRILPHQFVLWGNLCCCWHDRLPLKARLVHDQ